MLYLNVEYPFFFKIIVMIRHFKLFYIIFSSICVLKYHIVIILPVTESNGSGVMCGQRWLPHITIPSMVLKKMACWTSQTHYTFSLPTLCFFPVSAKTCRHLLRAGTITLSALREIWPHISCGRWDLSRIASVSLKI